MKWGSIIPEDHDRGGALSAYLTLHASLHAGRHIGLRGLSFVDVIGEGQKEITPQYQGAGIFNIVVPHIPADGLILVEQVFHGEFQLPILLFKELMGQTGIPQRYGLIEAGAPSGVDIVVEISAPHPILHPQIGEIGGIRLSIVFLVGARGGLDRITDVIVR